MSTISVAGVDIDTRHFIGGQRVASSDTYTNTSPIDGMFLGEISRGGQSEVDAAVAAARAAFPAWAQLGPVKRGALRNKRNIRDAGTFARLGSCALAASARSSAKNSLRHTLLPA